MFEFTIYYTTIWSDTRKKLESFKTQNLKKGIEKATKNIQKYVNNGTVNDYTNFATCEMECKKGIYTVSHNKLINFQKKEV